MMNIGQAAKFSGELAVMRFPSNIFAPYQYPQRPFHQPGSSGKCPIFSKRPEADLRESFSFITSSSAMVRGGFSGSYS